MCRKDLETIVNEFIEAAVKEVRKRINKDIMTYDKEVYVNTDNVLRIKPVLTHEELKSAAKLGLRNKAIVQSIDFYDVPTQESVVQIKDGGLKINCDGIKVNHGKGNITFNHEGLSFDFGVALEYIKQGINVCRKGWNGKGLYVKLEKGGDYEFSEILPYFVIKNTSNSFNTWVPSVSDLMADDWTIAD